MQKYIYKLAWFIVPIIFLAIYISIGESCLMLSCSGDKNDGIIWGIVGISVYSIFLKFIASKAMRSTFLDISDIKHGFFYYLIILLVLLVYFLGKNATI